MRCRLAARFGVLCLLTFTIAVRSASAQRLEGAIAKFNGGMSPEALAAGRDAAILALGNFGEAELSSQLFAAGTTSPTAPNPLAGSNDLGPALVALARGGYGAAWLAPVVVPDDPLPDFDVMTQRLSPRGEPTGPALPVFGPTNAPSFPGIARLGEGFVVAWNADVRESGRRLDATGTPIGGVFDIGVENDVANTFVAPVGGGFVVVWGRDSDTEARLFDADATPVTGRFTVAESFEPTGVAVDPAGTRVMIVGVPHAGDPSPNEIRMRTFAPDGSAVSGDVVVASTSSPFRPSVASDASGNALVVWGGRTNVRGYDAHGTALGPPTQLSTLVANQIAVTGRPEGGFFLAWRDAEALHAARVTLCTPGTAVCGDGILATTCEVCDAGAGNSDTTPDACRTDCRLPTCGDGVTDAGEQCDDGNLASCDGCDGFCDTETGTVCGDGLAAPLGCPEQCDDGNGTGGDGCSPTCTIERILGGGPPTTDCYTAWRIDNPSNDPRFDRRGNVNPRQVCRDDDPACDFDGGTPGSCTFRVGVCVNNDVPPGCAPRRLRTWALASPNVKQAAARPELAAVRAALESVVLPNVVGSSDPNRCSPNAEVVVPLRGTPGAYKPGKLKLKSRADLYTGATDTDSLQLRCEP
jgi:cysteine-rich repeat protein